MTEIKKIGFIGLGVMGHAITANLIADGYELYVYNRTASKADDLVANGAATCQRHVKSQQQATLLSPW